MQATCRAALFTLVAAVPALAEERPALVVLALEDQANAIWSGLPSTLDDARLTVRGASRECSAEALRQAGTALAQGAGGRMALRNLSLELAVPGSVGSDLARGRPPAEVIAPYVATDTHSDHVGQALAGGDCEEGGAFYDLRAAPGSPGRVALHLLAEGACGCRQGGGGSGRVRFHLVGEADLQPGIVERKNVLRLRAGAARYSLTASCGSCVDAESPRTPQPSKVDPCAAPCGALADGFAAWLGEVNQAAAKITALAGQATTLELDISTQRRELDAAQASPGKPRAVLERISALQDRIKAAQAELSRVTRASQEIQKYLDAARQASEETGAADERCRSQCRARSERSPRQEASSGQGAASGGGVSSGVLIAGGAALAAGGVALALSGGGDSAAAAEPSFAGTWRGTRTTDALVRPPLRCVRTFDETWVITQSGRDLHAAITATAQGCGDPAACGTCQIFAFPREHFGSADGSTARFFVFPELQVPSCVLPLRLQGDTLSGSMPACETGNNITLSDVVTLRRASP